MEVIQEQVANRVAGFGSQAVTDRDSLFLQWLIDAGKLSAVVAERIARVQAETSDRLTAILLKLGLLSEPDLAAALCRYCDLPALQITALPVVPVEIPSLNSGFLWAREVLPLRMEADTLEIACWDALDDFVPRACEFALARKTVRYVSTRAEILRALDTLYGRQSFSSVDNSHTADIVNDEEIDRLKDLASDAPVIRLVQTLIDQAVSVRASDIHLEPSEHALNIRLRIDGLLREQATQPREFAAPVASRIKVMAGLNIAERRLPQDGRIRVGIQGKEVDFRVATSPTLHGESVVLRILDRQDVALDFGALGFAPELMSTLREAIARPYGIVLVTGPTGSGKTTTLYAALKEINTPDRKILTVEDPVEYTLAGVNQVPVRPQIGLNFAQALRAFLRQDPDVLMVGEIRDRETAEVAIQAALTGHLLLSTLHTNTAAAAVTRLLDMGIDDYLLASTLHLIVGQRLVRRLCAECSESFTPSREVCERHGLSWNSDLAWRRPRGCAACQGSGFRGRTAIIEALRMTDAVRDKVLARADAFAIEKAAVANGMRTMVQHGLERVVSGHTTLEEVLRVTSLT